MGFSLEILRTREKSFLVVLLTAVLGGCTPFVYYSTEATTELRSAMMAANDARIDGPTRVQLAGHTTLFVQSGLVFIPPGQAERLLKALGTRPTKEMLGLLVCPTPARTEIAILYSRSKPGSQMPELEIAAWREAPDLAVLGPARFPGSGP